jgi:hypothetical protein
VNRSEAFAAALESTSNIDVRRDYSGREMYGDLCVGVTFKKIGELLEAVYWLGRQDEDGEFQAEIANADMDSMGRGSIVYWRDMQMDTGEVEEDEECDALDSV